MFKKYDVYAVTYGLEKTATNPPTLVRPDSTMWVLNFVYNGILLGTAADGDYNTNPLVFPEFSNAISGTGAAGAR